MILYVKVIVTVLKLNGHNGLQTKGMFFFVSSMRCVTVSLKVTMKFLS